MNVVLQVVREASVEVEGSVIGKIGKGFLLLVGIGEGDDETIVEKMAEKISKLRIFQDGDGKTNCSLADVKGELLVVSQFTLLADCKKGNRPSFVKAGDPKRAEELYEHMIAYLKTKVEVVEHGAFGADMKVALVNDGPFTLALDSDQLFGPKTQ